VDIFGHYGVTTILDHMFLATHVDYYRKGIGSGLVAATVDMARAINRGEDVGVPISDDTYPWKNKKLPRVQAVIALFTSPVSQRIGKSLGWEELFVVRYDQLFLKGEPYSSRLDKNNKTTSYMSIKI
jgi:GNAT superfamily N-acetyltransferase